MAVRCQLRDSKVLAPFDFFMVPAFLQFSDCVIAGVAYSSEFCAMSLVFGFRVLGSSCDWLILRFRVPIALGGVHDKSGLCEGGIFQGQIDAPQF